eukprot:PITA_31182
MNMVDTFRNTGLYTWNNKRGGESHVASKLDRFLISEDIMIADKEVIVRVLPFGGSDHWTIQLDIKGIGTPRSRPFKFENIWLFHPYFFSNIEKWWSEDLQIQGTRMFLLHKRLKHINLRLKYWNKKDFGNVFAEKKICRKQMQDLNQDLITKGFDKAINDQVVQHHHEWENLCKQEEIFWRQRSRIQWLKEGERNTKFFHRSTIANRAHNRISSIKNEEGELLISHEAIEVKLFQHFQGITQENNSDRDHFIREVTRNIPKLVSKEDNFNLYRPITDEEVNEVLKDMQNGKAPSPDGFNVDFFKACWNIVKQDIVQVVEESKLNKTILKVLNTSFISLIPKQAMAQTPDKFRPIALCNVVYKIISKVVANRLKPLLPVLVLGEQSVYVEGRKILDNIIQAQEVVHSLTNKKQASMIMQLDISKAYDKVNWSYIKKVLIAFGFDHNWVRWVMALVTSSSFSILVNGSPSEIFSPSRGLRQGDPLSPFILILMMEGLGWSIKRAKIIGKIKGLLLTENGQALTHQQFVDDTMLQGVPTVKEASAYKKILNLFALASALLAPKGVLQQFRNIQRNFLWGKEETRRKWTLVSWDKICRPKIHGGLGLDDQEILNKVLVAKLWWRWVQNPETQWANIWKEKYASSWQTRDPIRMSGNIKGSHIWNKAWEYRSLVQENSF